MWPFTNTKKIEKDLDRAWADTTLNDNMNKQYEKDCAEATYYSEELVTSLARVIVRKWNKNPSSLRITPLQEDGAYEIEDKVKRIKFFYTSKSENHTYGCGGFDSGSILVGFVTSYTLVSDAFNLSNHDVNYIVDKCLANMAEYHTELQKRYERFKHYVGAKHYMS